MDIFLRGIRMNVVNFTTCDVTGVRGPKELSEPIEDTGEKNPSDLNLHTREYLYGEKFACQ